MGWDALVEVVRSDHRRRGQVIGLGNDLVLVIVISSIGRSIGDGD
jgi:hypothetical protein